MDRPKKNKCDGPQSHQIYAHWIFCWKNFKRWKALKTDTCDLSSEVSPNPQIHLRFNGWISLHRRGESNKIGKMGHKNHQIEAIFCRNVIFYWLALYELEAVFIIQSIVTNSDNRINYSSFYTNIISYIYPEVNLHSFFKSDLDYSCKSHRSHSPSESLGIKIRALGNK